MTIIFAHRGYSKKYPENTILAFQKALDYGAEAIELDIHLSADGQLVIIHDESIDRTANGQGLVKDLTLQELRKYRYDKELAVEEASHAEITIPTLQDFFDWFAPLNILANLEIKNDVYSYPGIVEKVIELVHSYQVEDRVIISSFNHNSVRAAKEINPDLACGFLTVRPLADPGDYCQSQGVEFYHPFYRFLTDAAVQSCRDHGIGANPYTVDDPNLMDQYFNHGIYGFFTNDLELALARQVASQAE